MSEFANPFGRGVATRGMTHNLGTTDRILRIAAALALLASSAFVPVSPLWLALPGVYLFATAGVGTCIGYRLIGRSTCSR